jgi:hypothetical protein
MMEAISTFRACILDAVSGLLQLVNEAPAATTITLMISIFVAAILTRVLTGSLYLKGDIQDGKRSVPTVPYWLPILGHTFQLQVHFQTSIQADADRITHVQHVRPRNFDDLC